MVSNVTRVRGVRKVVELFRCGASIGVLCAMGVAAPAYAQSTDQTPAGDQAGQGTAGATTPPTSQSGTGRAQSTSDRAPAKASAAVPGEIVVTGIRQSLANAQNIKRNADTVVDAITATDIGALPDRSVTEALQRVPGVSISRFAGNNDPDHFSVEGSGVFVRGLNFVRSEFNGRDAFAAGVGGQALNFSDVPSELLGSVEVFKNVTAENIEGGLAGTVNLNTRKPFDNKGLHVGFDAEANYGDFEKKWSPTGSVLISDTWHTGIGQIGLLGDVSYSRIRSRADGIQITNFQTRDNTLVLTSNSSSVYVCRNPLPSNSDSTTLAAASTSYTSCGAPSTAGADGYADPLAVSYAPLGGQFRTQDYDRKRDGIALAAQWESTDGKALLTLQFLRSHTTNAWGEHTFETAPDLSEYNTYPAGCLPNGDGPGAYPTGQNPTSTTRAECKIGSFQNYTYASDGLFQKGLITLPGAGWRSSCSSAQANCYIPVGGQQQSLSRRQVFEEGTNTDYGANMKIKPTDHLDVNLDFDYTKSRHQETDLSIFGSTFADEYVDLTGNIPVVTPQKPLNLYNSWGGTPPQSVVTENNAAYFADKNVQFWRAAMDHIEDSTGAEWAMKGDFVYHFDAGFLRDIKFGARYADRDETVRYTAYNWGALSEIWSGQPVSIAQSPANAQLYSFPNFFRGATPGPSGAYYYSGDLIGGYDASAAYFKQIAALWKANGSTAGTWVPAAERTGVVAGTPYLPSEIQPVSDHSTNLYTQFDFGRGSTVLFGGVRLSGNVGLRFTQDEVRSSGSIGAPTQQQLNIAQPFTSYNCAPQVPAGAPPGTAASVPAICSLGPVTYGNLQAFANGATQAQTAVNNYHYFLPSLNLKFGLSNTAILRLAGSKVLTKPDLSNIRNFLTFGLDSSSGNLTANAGNPYLKPATAWQFDASFEWYFARVGSLTFDAFYKSIHNFFYSALENRQVSNNGITETAIVRGPANYNGYGKIKGFEASYQQTFDFLPGFLKGLGTNLNYTFIDSSGLPNSFLNGGSTSSNSTVAKGNLPLEGLSRHNANASLFFENKLLSLRAAYNWRSKYLLTAADVIFPYYSIFQAAGGQLDASATINITKQVKIGVQGVNLLNQVTKTLQAYTSDPNKLAPRSYFVNDRRFSFLLRGNF